MKSIYLQGTFIIIIIIINILDIYYTSSHLKASRIQRSKTRCDQRGEIFEFKRIKRHLPQLLVRGDIVVHISRSC